MKRAIVTGSTGPLGAALVRYLADHDIEVAAVVRPGSRRLANICDHAKVSIVECDVLRLTEVRDKLSGRYDVFFHLAWSATESRTARHDPTIHALNIEYALQAVKVSRDVGCTTFVGAGSHVELVRDKALNSRPDETAGEESYGVAKYAAGKLTFHLCDQFGIRHCWARIVSLYGPGERDSTALMYCIYTLLNREKPVLTEGEQIWDYLYAPDCARALFLMAMKGKHGHAYLVASGESKPLKEYFEAARDAIDPTLPLGLGERVYPPGQIMRVCADIRSLTEHTGFVPRYSFKEGIHRTIEWARKQTATFR